MDWRREAREQLGWHWTNHIRPRLAGLTDEEYLWEPVPGCWSLRPRGQARTSMAAGAGDLVIDWESPEPVPPPLTTIAWRLGHVIVGVFGARNAAHFGGPPADYESFVWPAGAHGALAELDAGYDRWTAGVAAFLDEDWSMPVGPAQGPWAASPYAALVLHINREVIHHMAEVLVLRDLFRHRP